jgi:hypothetical protein
MKLRSLALIVLVLAGVGIAQPASAASHSREVTFVNNLDETVWMAGWQQTAKPALKKTGWVLEVGATLTITVPNKWNGRFWARTGCEFDKGKGHCVTGDCDGRFQCRGYGSLPASLAEFNLDAWKKLDFYDVSLVDGSNVPMWINIAHGKTKDALTDYGCSAAGCTTDVVCPKKLRVDGGCISPCAQFGTDKYCCADKYAVGCSPKKTWPINYAKVFKRAEPFAYSWSGDDATSMFTCTGYCDYRITLGVTPAGHTQRPGD